MDETGIARVRRSMNDRALSFGHSMKKQIFILGGFIILIWLIEIIDRLILGEALDAFGVQPRMVEGLLGIPLMPFLHSGFGHLLANTIPFLVLGFLVMLNGKVEFFAISAVIILVSGLGVWLLGPANSVHIGASGLVLGFMGFLVTRAYFERSLRSILLALAVILFYGGLLWGILPMTIGVSWQAHLFGFAGGVLAAYGLAKRKNRSQTPADSS